MASASITNFIVHERHLRRRLIPGALVHDLPGSQSVVAHFRVAHVGVARQTHSHAVRLDDPRPACDASDGG